MEETGKGNVQGGGRIECECFSNTKESAEIKAIKYVKRTWSRDRAPRE